MVKVKNEICDDLRDLSYELKGVILDVENGNGFDEICLNTIKRVQAALSNYESNADLFWDHTGDRQGNSIEDILAGMYDDGIYDDGAIVTLQQGKRFPDIEVRLVVRPDGNVDYEVYHG
jgi:hypothetical protein